MYYQDCLEHQNGAGNAISAGINRVYVGSAYQRGHGIGKFLGGLFRKAIPLLSRGSKALGREALRTGLNVLTDVAHAVPLKESVRKRVKESGGNLKRKVEEKFDAYMEGDGYNAKRRMLSPFVLNSLGTVRAAYEARKNNIDKIKKQKLSTKKKRVKKQKSSVKKKKKKKKKQKKKQTVQKDIFD